MRNNDQCISYSEFLFSSAVISQQHGQSSRKFFKDFPGIYQLKHSQKKRIAWKHGPS